jgi:hypothetical protein
MQCLDDVSNEDILLDGYSLKGLHLTRSKAVLLVVARTSFGLVDQPPGYRKQTSFC